MKISSKVVFGGCLLSGLCLSAPAFTQTGGPSAPSERLSPSQQTPTTAAPSERRGADEAATRSTQNATPTGSVQYLTEHRAGLWRASKLEGVDVYNEQNDKIGDITEVLLDEAGQVEAVVIGVGGFLGLGQRNVAVPFKSLKWQMTAPVSSRADSPAIGTRPAPATGRDTVTGPGAVTAPVEKPAGAAGARSTNRAADITMRDVPERAILAGASRDQLKDAPEFKYMR